jgi:hypothetical protein
MICRRRTEKKRIVTKMQRKTNDTKGGPDEAKKKPGPASYEVSVNGRPSLMDT